MFFFFFKQKAAYEMRSSDWSSDVCSSDLIGGNGQRQADREACSGGTHRLGRLGVRRDDAVILALAREHRARPVRRILRNARRLLRRLGIGRAAWRVRGGP